MITKKSESAHMDTKLDPFDQVPMYYQLYNKVRQKIEDSEWKPRQPIPSERELQEFYNVSRTTVRQAVSLLVNHGFLYREHGRGTFVSPPKLKNSLHVLSSFSEDMRSRGMEPGQQILQIKWVEPTTKIRQQLELPDDRKTVLLITRLRLANDEPIGIHSAYLPLHEEEGFSVESLEAYGSLYKLLEEKYDRIPTEADETIESVVADEREAALLNIYPGSPLLLIQRIVWSQKREAMEYVKVIYRADRYQYYIHLSRQ